MTAALPAGSVQAAAGGGRWGGACTSWQAAVCFPRGAGAGDPRGVLTRGAGDPRLRCAAWRHAPTPQPCLPTPQNLGCGAHRPASGPRSSVTMLRLHGSPSSSSVSTSPWTHAGRQGGGEGGGGGGGGGGGREVEQAVQRARGMQRWALASPGALGSSQQAPRQGQGVKTLVEQWYWPAQCDQQQPRTSSPWAGPAATRCPHAAPAHPCRRRSRRSRICRRRRRRRLILLLFVLAVYLLLLTALPLLQGGGSVGVR